MKTGLPPSIKLIHSSVKKLDKVYTFLKPNSVNYTLLKNVLNEGSIIDEDDRFLSNPEFITYVQTSLLICLSMFGGIFVPNITNFNDDDTKVNITWDTGSSDTFLWGVYNDDFRTFSRYFQDRLSSKPQHRSYLPVEIFQGIFGFIKSYILILNSVNNQITKLIAPKYHILDFLNQDISKDLLFIIISSLPGDQMNAMYVYIQQFFPSDLEVTSPDGKKMNVISLFESASVDIYFLIEKTKIYMDLYFNNSMPIIKQITQSKTLEFIQKSLDNTTIYNVTIDNLKNLKTNQIDTRLALYKTFKNHLDSLI